MPIFTYLYIAYPYIMYVCVFECAYDSNYTAIIPNIT